MNYQLVFDPDLGVRPDRFAAAWNGDPACRQVATAQVAVQRRRPDDVERTVALGELLERLAGRGIGNGVDVALLIGL